MLSFVIDSAEVDLFNGKLVVSFYPTKNQSYKINFVCQKTDFGLNS